MSEQTGEETNALAILPPEPWGRRIKRGREFAGMTLDDAVAAVGRFMLTSTASISRMEDAVEVPKDPRRRALAYLAAVSYELEPDQFGVRAEDLPAALAAAVRAERSPRGGGRPMAFVPEGVDPSAVERAVGVTGATIHFRRKPAQGPRRAPHAA